MAFTGHSLSERMSRWQVLIGNLKEEQEALPHVTEDLTQLEALLPEVRALQDRYEAARAQAREANAELVRLAKEGDRIRGRLGATLRGRFGFDSEALIRYGYKPNRPSRRRRSAAQASRCGRPEGRRPLELRGQRVQPRHERKEVTMKKS